VVAVAVGFDDEQLGGEEEVDFEVLDPRVDLGPWEAVVVAEGEHALFEFALRQSRAAFVLV
jgi:hypothetical protein